MLKKHSECVVIKDKTQPFASDPQRLFQQSKPNHLQHWAIKKTFFFFFCSPSKSLVQPLSPYWLLATCWHFLDRACCISRLQSMGLGLGGCRQLLFGCLAWAVGCEAGASASTWAYPGTRGNVEAWSSCAEQNSAALEHHRHPLVFALHPLCSWDTTRRRDQSIFLHTTLSGLVSPFSPGN